jgi:hypothetical protein
MFVEEPAKGDAAAEFGRIGSATTVLTETGYSVNWPTWHLCKPGPVFQADVVVADSDIHELCKRANEEQPKDDEENRLI